jgi:hypothetical protein
MDIEKHKRYQYRYHDAYDRSGDIRTIEKCHYGKHKQDDGHQSSSKTIQSICDIDGIDDADRNEEGDDWIE